MQTLTEKVWNLGPPDGLFTKTVLKNLFSDKTENEVKFIINKALKKNEIIRLKPGFYCLAEKYRTSSLRKCRASSLWTQSDISAPSGNSYTLLFAGLHFRRNR